MSSTSRPFRAALRSFLRRSEQIAQANGLTPQRHLLLLMIKGAPDGSEHATMTDLAERLQLAQSSVTELAMRAEQTRLIERERSDVDARVAHLRLTKEGRAPARPRVPEPPSRTPGAARDPRRAR